jgi:hypothetical protein
MHLLAQLFVFSGDNWGFQKEEVKIYLLAPLPPLNSPFFSINAACIVYMATTRFIKDACAS